MEKTITIPARLLERVREIPGADGMTDSQLVSLCMEAGLGAAEREGTPSISSTVAAINRLLDRANLRQLSLVLRMLRAIVGEGATA